MIPDRFVTEYPARCIALLDEMEPIARDKDMLGSFAVLTAGSILNIPLERLSRHHPINGEFESDLYHSLRAVKKQPWATASFWRHKDVGQWHFARVVTDPNQVSGWNNEKGQPSMSDAANTIGDRTTDMVLRVLRNALAHGNVVYLNEDGRETAGTRLHSIGFLSRYEESAEQRAAAQTYRLIAVSENDFVNFIRCWANWLSSFSGDYDLVESP